MEAWFADLARWVRRHEAALASDASTTTLQIDLSHLHYLLVRCEGLGRDVGPLDLEVAPPRPVARPADETRSLFSIQDTLHSLSTWWGPSDAPDDRVFRYLHTQCMRVRRLRLTPATGAPGLADFPGAHATPLHTFKSLTHLTLDGVPPAAVVGWDRLCVQLTHLTALHTGVPDMADVFVDLVRRDTRRDSLPAAAWHALRHVALPHNELTFLSSDALDALPALAHLDVSHNLLNAVPPALDSAPHLQSLSVADNLIDSVLGIYHTLPHIRALDLRGNRVDSLCGVERLARLAQLDLRDNLVADVREVGRLATLPHLSHVWIAGNPVLRAEPDARVACLAEFALERHAVVLDDAAPSFWERRRLAERLSHQVPAGASRGGELSAYRERIEQLRSRQGDDWLRTVARSELGEDASAFPVHAVVEVAPIESFPWPVRSFVRVVSHPVGAAAVSAAALGGGAFLWWRFFRRIPSAAYITPAVLRSRRMLVGRVTSVGDADGFRLYHTPGLPLLRSWWHRVPTQASELRRETISVRLAGADAPEAAHFGREGQPFADEARAELRRLIEGRTVWLDMAHIDQYQRLVGVPYVWRWPYVWGRTNVSLALVRRGLATVYRSAGAAYGSAGWLSRWLLHASSGRAAFERAEEHARRCRLGMWSLGRKLETPGAYKHRMR
ncbi:Similar to S.cerevisiae protein LCL3 (Putative protein of unknown function) [Malassezia sympodialis ATCC 42132]|uniref:TNase-like domain-containing protein n=1 Tax=Malassezia sympodialis (strain ATCC 42132) TaxID=1230383 RepID=A0A1M8A2K6_MALS4|nr:Similar to S.cerevisiae protein LCL3 (Putative protein of unknown function) [Malassezia sympodialis ATCC 42132]